MVGDSSVFDRLKIVFFSLNNYFYSLLSVISSVILARNLSVNEFGVYSYALLLSNFIFISMQYGLDKSLVRDFVQKKNTSALLGSSLLLWLLLGLLHIFIAISWLVLSDNSDLLFSSVLILFSGLFQGLSPRSWFDASSKQFVHSIIVVWDRIIFLSGICLIFYVLNNNFNIIKEISLLLFLSRFFSLLLEWSIILFRYRVKVSFDKHYSKYLLSANFWLWVASLGNLMITHLSQTVLESAKGKNVFAYYSLAFQMILVFRLFQNQFLRLFSAKISSITKNRRLRENIFSQVIRYGIIVFVTSLFFIIPAYYFIDDVIFVLIGMHYERSVFLFRVLLIWVLFYGVALIVNQFLIGLRLQKEYFKITLAFGVVSLVLTYFLVRMYGDLGAAVALIVAHLGSVLTQIVVIKRNLMLR